MFAKPALVPVTVATAIVAGMVLALLGSIKLPLAKRLQINEDRIGGLLSAFFLAVMPMMLVHGVLVDRYGVQVVLILSSVATALALAGLAVSRTYFPALGSILALGMAWAGISNAGTILMKEAFFEGHPTASFLLGNAFFGLGALVTPALGDYLIRLLTYRKGLAAFAILSLMPVLTAALTSDYPVARSTGELGQVLQNPILWLTALGFALYAPLEAILGTWATTWLTELQMSERKAALFLSGFWLTFLGSRLFVAFLGAGEWLPEKANPWLIVGLALAAAMILGSLAGAPTAKHAGIRLLMLGALFGPIFPALVGILLNKFESDQGTAYGAMFCFGAVGNLMLPPLFGTVARRRGIQRALRFTPVLAVALACAVLVTGLWLQL